jgi:Na+/H+ antiporter NhaD/arsenite permease-like protein
MTRCKHYLYAGLVLAVIALGLWLKLPLEPTYGQEADADEDSLSIIGRLLDPQGQPVGEAEILVFVDGGEERAGDATSQEDGTFVAILPIDQPQRSLRVEVERPHFEPYEFPLSAEELADLRRGGTTRLPDITLERRITPAFWAATLGFVGILALMALEKLHNTTATLVGASCLLVFSYVGSAIDKDQFFIFEFERAISYIDFDVIFLVMGMMIVVGIMEGTGIFQWMAFMAYRLSRGRITVLMVILVIITSIASALLDNVTTMLLMAPITLQIALALGVNPLALLIPEVLASNVGGISTLIGTPTNIMIGLYADIGFNDFLVNLTVGVVMALIVLVIYIRWFYRAEFHKVSGRVSPALYAKLEENAKIKDPAELRKSLVVFGVILALFLFGEALHLTAVVTALAGATVFLVWVETDVERQIKAVDWTTLVFFMALFMAVGAIQEVGLIGYISEFLGALIGGNQVLGLIILVWAAAFISMLIDNIPFTAAMLPVVSFLSGTLDPAGTRFLFYGLSVGSAMGGNGTLIGSSPNVVTAGILERAGYPISYMQWLKVGLPTTILTVAIGTMWLVFRFFVLAA